ncbi:hypothetical protein NIES208_02620 [[Limnothrix rosea] IAM M-220]|nr:hypothetical protein NIES208_02620 [[Limnothrix rosea] IAM M-220]
MIEVLYFSQTVYISGNDFYGNYEVPFQLISFFCSIILINYSIYKIKFFGQAKWLEKKFLFVRLKHHIVNVLFLTSLIILDPIIWDLSERYREYNDTFLILILFFDLSYLGIMTYIFSSKICKTNLSEMFVLARVWLCLIAAIIIMESLYGCI